MDKKIYEIQDTNNCNKKVPYFKMCIIQNFPFIEADFDAITEYQLLCKVVEYLNKVITQMNCVTTEMQNLVQQFNDLKTYVDNYFKNLDVQEEINNKLDEMVQDGTLAQIINQEIFGEIQAQLTDINNTIYAYTPLSLTQLNERGLMK